MTKKYISLIATPITEFALVKISVDGNIIEPFTKITTTGSLHLIEVNVTWTGVKRISLTSIQGSFISMHTEIIVGHEKPYTVILKDNVYLNNQPVNITRTDEDGHGEWHYHVPDNSTLSFDLVIR
jgi:hypothetical protein